MDAPFSLPLSEAARLLVGHVWLERRLFDLLGSVALREGDSGASLYLLGQARRHFRHAEMLEGLLPVSAPFSAIGSAVGEDPACEEVFRRLEDLGESPRGPVTDRGPEDVGLVVGVSRVLLPRMAFRYAAHLRRTAPVADGPLRRVLRSVFAEEVEAWHEGEELIVKLLASASEAEAVAREQGVLEGALAPSTLLGPAGILSRPPVADGFA